MSEQQQRSVQHPAQAHKLEYAAKGFNQWLALKITKGVGTMFCAYLFAVLAILGFPGLNASIPQYVQWVSQVFIQLVMLSILAVSQDIQGHHLEKQSEAQYQTAINTYNDAEEIKQLLKDVLAKVEGN